MPEASDQRLAEFFDLVQDALDQMRIALLDMDADRFVLARATFEAASDELREALPDAI